MTITFDPIIETKPRTSFLPQTAEEFAELVTSGITIYFSCCTKIADHHSDIPDLPEILKSKYIESYLRNLPPGSTICTYDQFVVKIGLLLHKNKKINLKLINVACNQVEKEIQVTDDGEMMDMPCCGNFDELFNLVVYGLPSER